MGGWPRVEEGASDPPPPAGGWVDEDLVLADDPRVLAWGSVDGIPWQLEAWSTAPGPRAKWWEHGPVGPEMAFWLGEGARFGGGGGETRLNEHTDLAASIHVFGSHPQIVPWVGVVSDRVARIEVRMEGGETRTTDIRRGPAWLPRFFCFFVPRGAPGNVVAVGKDGQELQADALVDIDVGAKANAGTSVNGFAYRADRPPPGWPDDTTEYASGEGPRHAEDFHLHEASFPLYVVHPKRWKGYVGTAGSGRSGTRLDHVSFGYFDEPGGRERGFEVMSERPDIDRRFELPLREEDVGIWRDAVTDSAINFAARFISRDELWAFEGERGFSAVGPSRIAAMGDVDVAGRHVRCARIEYGLLPLFRSIRFDLPDVRITSHGWTLAFEDLEGYARMLERLQLGTPLFRAMQAAGARSGARFQQLHGHHHAGPGAG